MKYHEAADYLLSFQQRRPKLGIDTTARMLSHFGDPHEEIDCVQIAGSNGKGSTATLLAETLQAAGLDVGLFTSPGLNDFREQVRINGRRIPKSKVIEHVDRIDPIIETLREENDEPTHFEVLTAIAIAHFGAEDVDVAVLEVGIGGRYDATSAVDPIASAVTSVSLEHTELLGDTVEEIARDKAQVAPEGAPLVTGTGGSALEAIKEETEVVTVGAEETDVRAVETGMRSASENTVSISADEWSLETHLSLLGQHQAVNAGIAATLARQIADMDESTIARGLRAAKWPGRFELMSTAPTIALDGSHNPGAMETVQALLERYEYDRLHVVFGAMSDKDHEAMVTALPAVDTAFVTRPDIDRAESVSVLADAFEGHADSIQKVGSVPEATERAIATADPEDFVLVTGSLYAISEARDRWTRRVIAHDQTSVDPWSVFSGATFENVEGFPTDYHLLSTQLRPAQAAWVETELSAIGGVAESSGLGSDEKLLEVVCAGTTPQLEALADRCGGSGRGLAQFGEQVREAIDDTAASPFGLDRTAVMGILNVTPDSFYDGGEYDRLDAAVDRVEQMLEAGADIIDIGGESTRPGAEPVSVEDEIDRVVPVIEAISEIDVPISIDTRKAAVADAALSAGADIVNDVSGLDDPAMAPVVADHDASLVLMHSLSAPVDPERSGDYGDVVRDVIDELVEPLLAAERAGIDREDIIIDPGCGFGKDPAESFELVDRLGEFRSLGCPVLIGHSRKSMLEPFATADGDRLVPTLAVTAMAVERDAAVVRVHDVEENATVVQTVSR